MRQMHRICFGLSVFVVLLLLGTHAKAEEELAVHTTPEGILITSYTSVWPMERLTLIEDELRKNGHSYEIEYLDRIEIRPDLEPGGNRHVSASYHLETKQVDIPIKLSGFLPEDYNLPFTYEKGVIQIYQGEQKQELTDLASDLSHEYGHHFTFFYFGDAFGTADGYKESEYYRIRGLHQYDRVNGSYSYDQELHRWSIYELAAEDYRQILGSPTGKQSVVFQDIAQKAGLKTYTPINTFKPYDYNVIPQENWDVPLAHQVRDLVDYFFALIDIEYPYAEDMLNLPELSYQTVEEHGFRKVIFSWEPYDGDIEYVYTLIAYDADYSKVLPIKTVATGEPGEAVIGTVTLREGRYLYYYQDGLDQGTMHFVLHILREDGYIVKTRPLTIVFEDSRLEAPGGP